jgi:hypothetical protein
MTQSGSYTLITLAPLLVILIGLGITVTIDPYINRGQRGVLLLIPDAAGKAKKEKRK